jgi:hypothetical protein
VCCVTVANAVTIALALADADSLFAGTIRHALTYRSSVSSHNIIMRGKNSSKNGKTQDTKNDDYSSPHIAPPVKILIPRTKYLYRCPTLRFTRRAKRSTLV